MYILQRTITTYLDVKHGFEVDLDVESVLDVLCQSHLVLLRRETESHSVTSGYILFYQGVKLLVKYNKKVLSNQLAKFIQGKPNIAKLIINDNNLIKKYKTCDI